uniref:LIM zinc-binding domain-containing protein n=1 Tax=Angiostrongylus cantonensis TaxID=6313 RepID=A0A0K0DNZ8_ANGCA
LEMIKCAACTHPILDRYMLQADGRLWHEDCLKVFVDFTYYLAHLLGFTLGPLSYLDVRK